MNTAGRVLLWEVEGMQRGQGRGHWRRAGCDKGQDWMWTVGGLQTPAETSSATPRTGHRHRVPCQ